MREHPRRTLLGGIGSTVAIAAAGCLSLSEDDDSPSEDEDADRDDESIETLLEYVPAAFDEPVTLTAADLERLETADPPETSLGYLFGIASLNQWGVDDGSAITASVTVEHSDDPSTLLTILEFEDDDVGPETLGLGSGVTLESRDRGDTTYDYATLPGQDGVVAVVDDIAVFADSQQFLEDALDAAAEETTRLLETQPALETGFERFAEADVTVATANSENASDIGVDPDEFRYGAVATTVLDEDTLEYTYAAALESESQVTDETLEAFRESVGEFPPNRSSELTTETDGSLMLTRWTVDLEAQRQAMEHDSPSGLQLEDVDLEAEYAEVRVTHGEPTPVDELTIEIDGEPYDEEIWADGQERIEEGDTVRIETELLRPNLPVTITHEIDGYSTSVTTNLLGHLPFDFDHDPDAETVTVRYEDDYPHGGDHVGADYPLDGDHVVVAVHDQDYQWGDPPEPLRTDRPWEGTTLSPGDETTLEDVEPGMTIIVGWDGTSYDDSIANFSVSPPGTVSVDYEYETNTLTVELRFDADRREPADAYELRLDDRPAPKQWSDDAETVEDGSTIVIEDVDVGTNVSVTWGDGVHVGGGTAAPSVSVTASLEDGDLVLAHEGGPALPASALSADVYTDGRQITAAIADDDLAGDTFADGDAVTVMEDVDTDHSSISVSLTYNDTPIGSDYIVLES